MHPPLFKEGKTKDLEAALRARILPKRGKGSVRKINLTL
jgi:hypothetical protein